MTDHIANTDQTAAEPGWQPMRGPFSRWPRASDALLALTLFVISVGSWMNWASDDPDVRATGSAAAVIMAVFLVGNLSLFWRRSNPSRVHVIVLALSILAMIMTPVYGPIPALMVTLYSLGRYERNQRWSHLGLGAGLLLVAVDELAGAEPTGGGIVSVAVAFLLWYVGRRVRLRGEYLRLLRERADQLEREQLAESEKAVGEERTRIARELHDIVAHQVSLMTVQAGAAKTVITQNPDAAKEAMQSVEKAGRQALNELRHLVSVLRPNAEGGGLGPQPGSTDLPRLVKEIRSAGLEVRLDMNLEGLSLPARVDLSIYRIVQESLTNVLKHAGPHARASVTIGSDEKGVVVEVANSGGLTTRLPGSGHGIVGMRERVHLLGGSLLASPQPGGGFKVVAYLPVSGGRH